MSIASNLALGLMGLTLLGNAQAATLFYGDYDPGRSAFISFSPPNP